MHKFCEHLASYIATLKIRNRRTISSPGSSIASLLDLNVPTTFNLFISVVIARHKKKF